MDTQSTIFDDALSDAKQQQLLAAAKANLFELLEAFSVVGPCCFAGDIIAHQRPLPLLDPGDAVMVHDTGAYCFSNHFMYNALTPDPVYSSSKDEAGQYLLTMINAGDSIEQLIENFS